MSVEQGQEILTIEQKVSQIWQSVLSTSAENSDATFFELGGESISAIRIVSGVEEELGIEIDVADIFEEDPTLPRFIGMVTQGQAG